MPSHRRPPSLRDALLFRLGPTLAACLIRCLRGLVRWESVNQETVLSLHQRQRGVRERHGRLLGWLFSLGVLLLSGFGVYIGRFLRWNSWDVLTSPRLLVQDLLLHLSSPALLLKTATVTLALTAIFTFTYVIFVLLPQLGQPATAYSGD